MSRGLSSVIVLIVYTFCMLGTVLLRCLIHSHPKSVKVEGGGCFFGGDERSLSSHLPLTEG